MPILLLPAAWGLVIVINVVPAFMPPTWAVLASSISRGPSCHCYPLTIGGSAMSAAGRTLLALSSPRRPGAPGQRPTKRGSAGRSPGPASAVEPGPRLRLLPRAVPSNPLFIAAGVGRVRLLAVAGVFFLSRAIADTFWVWTAGQESNSLSETFEEYLTNWQAIALQFVVLALLVALFRLPWRHWLGRRERQPDAARRN